MVDSAIRMFVLAGEPSGDRIGAALVRNLRRRVSLDISGIGGEALESEGLTPLYPMSDLAVMGIVDVVYRLPKLLWRIRQTVMAILAQQPDIVVLIDAQVFSRKVAEGLREAGFSRPVVLYVAPSVWAYAPQRAARLKPLFDEILAVLPFEPRVMAELSGPETHYVGHLSLGEMRTPRPAAAPGPVALLPGSRSGELRRHMPILKAAAARLAGHPKVTGFFIPTLRAHAGRLERELADWPVPVDIVTGREDRLTRYAAAPLAIAASGTATLELAMAGLPMVILYRLEREQAPRYRKLGSPPVGLPNIVLKETVVPEFVDRRPGAAAIADAAILLLDDDAAWQRQAEAFGRLQALMARGEEGAPREDPAERILARLGRLPPAP